MSERRYNISKDQLEYCLHCKRTVEEIADIFSVSKKVILDRIKLYDLDVYHGCKYCKNDNTEDLCVLVQWGKPHIVNVCESCFSNKVSGTRSERITKQFLYKEYVVKDRTLFDIQKELRCKQKTLIKYLKLYGFKEKYRCVRCGSTENLTESVDAFKYNRYCTKCERSESRLHLKNKYLKKLENKGINIYDIEKENKLGTSLFKISKRLGISYNFIKKQFGELGIIENKVCQICGSSVDLLHRVSKLGKDSTCCICKSCNYDTKMNGYQGYSKISQELFWGIYNELPSEIKKYAYFAELNKEFYDKMSEYDYHLLNANKRSFLYDFCIKFKKFKFVIEFNGDVFHANPEFYKESDCPNPHNRSLTSKDIWKQDDMRKDYVTANGGYLLIIWEYDYRHQKRECVSYCVDSIIKMFYSVLKDYDDYFEEWVYA